jgi:hypothetical protein
MTERENLLRALRFGEPEHIPLRFNVSGACWNHYEPSALEDLMASHPLLFPGFERSEGPRTPQFAPWQRRGAPYTDSWRCRWETAEDGLTGAVVGHPLADWSALEDFKAPDASEHDGWGPIDWDARARQTEAARAAGRLTRGGLRHGHTFLTLTYIRGYENVILDMADGEGRLRRLLEMIEAFNAGLVERWMALGVEWMGYPEDLGMQVGPMLSPAQFREWIRPVYERLMAPAREAGCVIHMHSDGDVRALADDLLVAGVEVLNLQDLVNGLDWIREHLKGRVCIDLDLDRQRITRYGTPAQIDAHVRRAVETLGDGRGGLMMNHGLYPGVPLENVKALMDAMERYAGYWS